MVVIIADHVPERGDARLHRCGHVILGETGDVEEPPRREEPVRSGAALQRHLPQGEDACHAEIGALGAELARQALERMRGLETDLGDVVGKRRGPQHPYKCRDEVFAQHAAQLEGNVWRMPECGETHLRAAGVEAAVHEQAGATLVLQCLGEVGQRIRRSPSFVRIAGVHESGQGLGEPEDLVAAPRCCEAACRQVHQCLTGGGVAVYADQVLKKQETLHNEVAAIVRELAPDCGQ
mmetsp:Transcript_45764/g.132019  ORF Transcript_45764/g.132019 Transcript_45764/m.132019 type:complete len:236 (-) Transcript_45764:201-908(-)